MTQLTIQQDFDLALRRHQAGKLHEAEQLYRQILIQQPEHAGAMHYLGVIAQQIGKTDVAVNLIRRALALDPNSPEIHNNLGIALKTSSRLDEAITAYRQAVALRPDYADAYFNLGNALKDKNLLDDAIAAYRQALTFKPNYAEAYNNLGIALADQGKADDAIAAYRQAIALKPNYPDACNNLGTALADQGKFDDAIAAYRQAIALKPNYPAAYSNLATVLADSGQIDAGIAACRQAIAMNPSFPQAYSNLANILKDKELLDDAEAACRQAIVLDPNLSEAYANLGNILRAKGEFDPAKAAFLKAIQLNAHNGFARWSRSLLLLSMGEYLQGWREYNWRLAKPARGIKRDFPQPQWDGSDARGKTILLHAESGYGDAIQFIRYLPLVRPRCSRLIFECQPPLAPLLGAMNGIDQIITRGRPLPEFDWHSPLQSLPAIFGTTLDTVPNTVPYLAPPPDRAAHWAARLPSGAGLKVGLAWSGSEPRGRVEPRTQSLQLFAPLAGVPNVIFFSLQKGPRAGQPIPANLKMIDYTADFHDFAETAALIQNLDLVIAVDTAVAHLAGALGKTVWILIPFRSDFRWLLNRNDTPWYPTMRLFRQKKLGDWDAAIAELVQALQAKSTDREST